MLQTPFLTALTLLLIVPFSSAQAQSGGVSLGQTRVIFSSGDKSQIINVINSSSRAYLVQTRVQTVTEAAPYFIVTPPLFALKGDSRQLMRILPLSSTSTLPADRESLFYLSVSAIPAVGSPVIEQDRLSVGLRFILKLFYRPAGLELSSEEAACRLTVRRVVQGLQINNPTPYYQTLGTLSSNGHTLAIDRKLSMVAPQSSLTLPVKVKDQVSWQTITDYGGLSPLCHQSFAVRNIP